MDVILAILFLGAIFAVVYYFQRLKEKGGAAGAAVSGAETLGRGAGWLLVKAYGVLLTGVGCVMLFSAQGSSAGTKIAGIAVASYGLYLIFGGSLVIY